MELMAHQLFSKKEAKDGLERGILENSIKMVILKDNKKYFHVPIYFKKHHIIPWFIGVN